jgi:hypothetical protein
MKNQVCVQNEFVQHIFTLQNLVLPENQNLSNRSITISTAAEDTWVAI